MTTVGVSHGGGETACASSVRYGIRAMARVLCALVCLAGAASAQSPAFEVVGQIGGSCHAVALSDGYAYIGEGANLTVLSVANPADPTYVGRVLMDNLVQDIAISGNTAYVALQESGICVVDITSHAAPKVTGNYATPGQAWNLDVSGNYLYVAYDNITGVNRSGLLILNVSQPTPTLVKDIDTFGVSDVDVWGTYAFCVGGAYLRVLDISVPASASALSTVTLPSWGNARAVRAEGNYLYVCVDNASPAVGLQIYGLLPDPANPSELGHSAATSQPYDVAILGTSALVAGLNSGLQVISIADPNNPTLTGELALTDQATKVAGTGTYAFVADGYGGCRSINIFDPADPVSAAVRAIATKPNGSRVVGSTAYVADGTQGLQFFNLSNPQSPVYRGRHAVDHYGEPADVEVAGTKAYVGGAYGLFESVNVTDILNPVRLGTYNAPSWVSQVRVSGDFAFLACQSAGTVVVNIADPTAMSFATSLASPQSGGGANSSVYSITASGSTLYAGYGGAASGMQIMIFDSLTPQLTESTHYSAGGPIYDIRLDNDRAYLSCWSSGLEIVKLTSPAAPEYWGSYDPGYVFQTCRIGPWAVVANADDVHVLDVGNPAAISYGQTIDLPGAIQHLTAFDETFCLVSSREAGLYILRQTVAPATWKLY